MEKNVAVVLGGTVPHAELIKILKDKGYFTILIDYLDHPVAKDVVDLHIQESTLDQEAVLKIAKEYNAELVISAAVDQANISACYAMEKMGKYVPYSYETACKITNKGYMKKRMLENGIPTSQYIYIDQILDFTQINIDFPVVVKPADSNSSNGVKKAANTQELNIYLMEALSMSRNNKAIVEECIEGREISAYCYVIGGKAKLLMTAERLSVTEGNDAVIKCYASIAPARISEKARRNAEKIATKIAQVFGFDNTPLFFQGMVKGDNIEVIEFAPRVAGGLSYCTIRENTGFDILEATLESYSGKEISMDSYHEPESIYVINTIYAKNGVFNQLIGMEDLMKEGKIIHSFLHKTAGTLLDDSRASSSRVGGFIVKADTLEEAKDIVAKVYPKIDVLDQNGESIMRRNLNLAEQWSLINQEEY